MTNPTKAAEEWAVDRLRKEGYSHSIELETELEVSSFDLKSYLQQAFLAGRASAPKIEDQRAKLLEQIKAYSFDKDTRGIHGYMVDEDIVRMEDVNKILGKSTASLPEPPEDK